jgi:hypothetical protein
MPEYLVKVVPEYIAVFSYENNLAVFLMAVFGITPNFNFAKTTAVFPFYT